MLEHLKGKHAVVTGGGTGIGLAIARALADAGAEVTITGRREGPLKEAAADVPGLHPLVMDVCDEGSVVDGFAAAVAARGPVQIVIANAGIAEGKALVKSELADWRRILTTNLDGAFLTVREALRTMLGTDWGRVIVISSVAGVRGLRGAPAYSASKHGVIGMMRALSEDYMGQPYTFNAICPGYVATAIIDQNVESISKRAGISSDEALAIMVKANRHKRLLQVEEVAEAAMWLCSPHSGSVNGQTVEIMGGMP